MKKEEINKLKRLLVEVHPDLHLEIKRRAVERGLTLRKWLLRAIMAQIKKEEQYE